MRISDWSSDVCSSDLLASSRFGKSSCAWAPRLSLRLKAECIVTVACAVRLSSSSVSTRSVFQIRLKSEEHTSELQSLMRISYAVFCLKKKKKNLNTLDNPQSYNISRDCRLVI